MNSGIARTVLSLQDYPTAACCSGQPSVARGVLDRAPMKLTFASCVTLAASCASPVSKPTKPVVVEAPGEEDDAEPGPAAETKKAPRIWQAKAALTPVKGSKLKPSIITFDQEEGDDTYVTSDELEGAKPGTYHLVVHEGRECGVNATKAGVPWQDTADTDLTIVVSKDFIGSLRKLATKLMLQGDESVLGRALILHDDKKGKPGKALACGVIEEADD